MIDVIRDMKMHALKDLQSSETIQQLREAQWEYEADANKTLSQF